MVDDGLDLLQLTVASTVSTPPVGSLTAATVRRRRSLNTTSVPARRQPPRYRPERPSGTEDRHRSLLPHLHPLARAGPSGGCCLTGPPTGGLTDRYTGDLTTRARAHRRHPAGELHYHEAGDSPLLLARLRPGVAPGQLRGEPQRSPSTSGIALDFPGFGKPPLRRAHWRTRRGDRPAGRSTPSRDRGQLDGGNVAAGSPRRAGRVRRLVTIGGVRTALFTPAHPRA